MYTGWSKRAPITFTGSGTNLPVRLVVTDATFLAAAKSDGTDIRIHDGVGELKHQIEYWSAAEGLAIVWFYAVDTARTHTVYVGNAAATDVQSFADVFPAGSDFSAGMGTLTATTAGAGSATAFGPTNFVVRDSESACIAAPTGYTYVREITLLRDLNDEVVTESGNIIAYYMAKKADETASIFRATSNDGGRTWANHAVVLELVDANNWYGSCSVIKFGASDYRLWTNAKVGGAGGVYYATSSDGLSWTVQPGSVISKPEYLYGEFGIPHVMRLRSGTFVMLSEGSNGGDTFNFSIFGASSADGVTWTRLNSGNPIFQPAVSGWDSHSVANPKLIELEDGTLLLWYNGRNAKNAPFYLGTATATSVTGTWTRSPVNPISDYTAATYGRETSGLAKSTDGRTLYAFCQDFTGDYQTAQIRRVEAQWGPGIVFRTAALADGVLIGQDLDGYATTFVAETTCSILPFLIGSAQQQTYGLVLIDAATLPAPNAAGTIAPNFILSINRSYRTELKGDLQIRYRNPSGTNYYWNGSSWTTDGGAVVAADPRDELRLSITDDGTNYVLAATKLDGTSVASASIAKSSVKACATGRIMAAGEPLTDSAWGLAAARFLRVRPYNAAEPTLTMGAVEDNTAVVRGGIYYYLQGVA